MGRRRRRSGGGGGRDRVERNFPTPGTAMAAAVAVATRKKEGRSSRGQWNYESQEGTGLLNSVM